VTGSPAAVARRVGALVLPLVLCAGAIAAAPPPGATSCSGCHATSVRVDTPVPPILGRKPDEIKAAMQAFRSGERPSTVMGRIAKGFSDGEILAIAVWLAAQPEKR
jgi:cytochrome subunit of sulfide dehydrogenase